MMLANEYQKELKRAAREREWQSELQMREALQAKFAADDRAEDEERRQRLRVRADYLEGLRQQKWQRREMYEAAVAAERKVAEEEAKKEAFRWHHFRRT